MVQVLDHQHIHPLADGSTAGCSDVGCEDGCGGLPEAPPEDSTPGSGWAFKPKKVKPGERSNLLDKVRNAPSWAEVKARRWMPRGVQPPGWLMWLLEKWAVLMRLGAPAEFFREWHPRGSSDLVALVKPPPPGAFAPSRPEE